MEFCESTGVGTRTNWATFKPDPNHSPDPGTGFLSQISYALQRGILLRRENPTYVLGMGIGRPSLQRRVVLSRRNTFIGGKCALPSALLVLVFIFTTYCMAVTDIHN